jgi:hypothetical protein
MKMTRRISRGLTTWLLVPALRMELRLMAKKSLYDEDDYCDDEDSCDYSEDEDYEDDENFGYDEDEDCVPTSTCADEFRSDIDLRSSDRENYRLEDAGDSDGSVICRETNDVRRSQDELTSPWS